MLPERRGRLPRGSEERWCRRVRHDATCCQVSSALAITSTRPAERREALTSMLILHLTGTI